MTYCMALRLDEGLIFLSDTRTNAGVDNVGTYRKLHCCSPPPTGCSYCSRQDRWRPPTRSSIASPPTSTHPSDHESLATVSHLHEAAIYIGRLGREVAQRHRSSLGDSATATFILGGQIAGERPDLFLVYPEGNYIRVSDDRPFLQIGESKYGKFMLELAVHAQGATRARRSRSRSAR